MCIRDRSGAALEYARETEIRTGRKAQGVFVPMAALEQRAIMTTSTAPEIVGTDHRADLYIQPFRNALMARRLGVRVLSGLTGNVSIIVHHNVISTSASAQQWIPATNSCRAIEANQFVEFLNGKKGFAQHVMFNRDRLAIEHPRASRRSHNAGRVGGALFVNHKPRSLQCSD